MHLLASATRPDMRTSARELRHAETARWLRRPLDPRLRPHRHHGSPYVDHCCSIDKLHEFADDTADLIYASHVLEHFGRHEVSNVLREWYQGEWAPDES